MRSSARDIDTSLCNKHQAPGTGRFGSSDVVVNNAGALAVSLAGTYPLPCESAQHSWRCVEGAATVLVNGREMAAVGCVTSHVHSPGVLVSGSPTVLVGGAFVNVFERARTQALEMLDAAEASLLRWNEEDRAHFREWFGTDDELAREEMLEKIRQTRERASEARIIAEDGDRFAHVDASDSSAMYMEEQFWNAGQDGADSQGGVVVHEASHYADSADTDDHVYGQEDCRKLATENPEQARGNADNIEYYVEGIPR